MTYGPALVFALALMPAASAAQLSDSGVSTTLGYRQYLDVLRQCCPPRAWRRSARGVGNYTWTTCGATARWRGTGASPSTTSTGERRASINKHDLQMEPRHETSVLVSWQALERPR